MNVSVGKCSLHRYGLGIFALEASFGKAFTKRTRRDNLHMCIHLWKICHLESVYLKRLMLFYADKIAFCILQFHQTLFEDMKKLTRPSITLADEVDLPVLIACHSNMIISRYLRTNFFY